MRNIPKIVIFFIAFLLALFTLSSAAQFKVTRVYDGDTVKAEGYDIEIKVRLLGIDAPETSKSKRDPGQPYSQKAKKHLAGLILNKVVEIKGYGMDPYNRILGVIYLNGKNINLEMVKAGLAEVHRGKPPKGFDSTPYIQAETAAREAKKGMWSQRDKYISPKEWRRMHKRK
jgi:micrococcal nuclease